MAELVSQIIFSYYYARLECDLNGILCVFVCVQFLDVYSKLGMCALGRAWMVVTVITIVGKGINFNNRLMFKIECLFCILRSCFRYQVLETLPNKPDGQTLEFRSPVPSAPTFLRPLAIHLYLFRNVVTAKITSARNQSCEQDRRGWARVWQAQENTKTYNYNTLSIGFTVQYFGPLLVCVFGCKLWSQICYWFIVSKFRSFCLEPWQ